MTTQPYRCGKISEAESVSRPTRLLTTTYPHRRRITMADVDTSTLALRERIRSNVAYEPMSGCWIWMGAVTEQGYGRAVTSKATPKIQTAHRLSWHAFHGAIPNGACVLHKCDTTSCVNPWHLFLGSNKDNTADMIAKGRHPMRGRERAVFCIRGHEQTEANSCHYTRRNGRAGRNCRPCKLESKRRLRIARA